MLCQSRCTIWNQIMGLDSGTNGTNLDHIYKNAECLIICVSQKR